MLDAYQELLDDLLAADESYFNTLIL